MVGRKEPCLGTGTGPTLVVWSANQRRQCMPDVLLSFSHPLLNRPSAFLDTQTASYTMVLFKISQISFSDLTIVTGSLCRMCSFSPDAHSPRPQTDGQRFRPHDLTPCNFSIPSSIPFRWTNPPSLSNF